MIEFVICIPPETDSEVVEWFEFMNSQNCLTNQLLKLIQQQINSKSYESKPESNTLTQSFSDNPLDNLFNWQEANSLTLVQNKAQKKKMLMV